jgi:hypothetical protein
VLLSAEVALRPPPACGFAGDVGCSRGVTSKLLGCPLQHSHRIRASNSVENLDADDGAHFRGRGENGAPLGDARLLSISRWVAEATVMQTPRLQYRDRWFCYLDLLGFKDLVRGADVGYVVGLYEDVVNKLEAGAEAKRPLGISYSWFSDTFIIFSRSDSLQDFTLLEQAGRLFFQRLILAEIPARGAISHGKLYSNLAKNIFVGEALIEAYEYGEKQNWLGFLLAPSVFRRLDGTELDVRRRYNYRAAPEHEVITHPSPENVFAFAFNNATVNGANPLLSAIQRMKRKAAEPYRIKYENTERFVLKHASGRAAT